MYSLWLKRSTWKALWIALLRAPKDRKARGISARLAASLLIFGAWLAFEFYQFRGFSMEFGRVGTVMLCIAFGGLLLVVAGGAVSYKLQQRALDRDSPAVPAQLKLALYRETCLLATLLERLGSEFGMEKELPANIEVITRRVLLNRLKKFDLRETLEPWLLDLLLAPDGHWTAEQKHRALPAWECAAVLLWVLGKASLPRPMEKPNYRVTELRTLFRIRQPENLVVLASWDLRFARDEAHMFFQRCWVELAARGDLARTDQDDVDRAIAIREEIMEDGYTGDYLVGAQTVTELPTPQLRAMAIRAWHRWEFVSLLVDILAGDASIDRLRQFFTRFFAPAEEHHEAAAAEPA